MAVAALDTEFVALCERALAEADVPGAALGVLHGGDEWLQGFGVLERGSDARVDAETTFRIASVTKPFTATLALYLAVSGALDLSETVPAPEADVTVRHVLAHVGGFESECGDLARFGDGDHVLATLATELLRQRQVVPPGELWSYCNAGYWLLGHVLADRNGTTYETALEDWVLRPLGLGSTGFGEPDAVGHDPEPERRRYPRARRPSGGLTSNVPNLLEFARLHLEAPETASLREPAVPTPGGFYGFGLMLDPVGDLQLWGHTGSWGGYESRLFFEPEHGFAFAGLANATAARAVLRELQDAAVERVLRVRREPVETVPLPAEELQLLAGRYASAEVELSLAVEGTGLAVDATEVAPDGRRTPLPPAHARSLGDRLFEIVDTDLRGSRFDFHPEGGEPRFVRFASRLAERLAEPE